MTVSNTSSRGDYTENGVTTQFPIPFYFLDDSHVMVIGTVAGTATILALGSDYTVAGAGVAGGGTLTILTPTNGRALAVLRDVPYTQLTHYVENDPFPAASHERALDLLTMQNQQQQEALGRAAVLPDGVVPSADVPTPVSGSVLGWVSGTWAWLSQASVTLAANLLTAARGFGADLVSYLAPYTGAVGRLLYLKLADSLNAKDFGVVGDGVTDDTVGFTAACAAAITANKTLDISDLKILLNTQTASISCTGLRLKGSGQASINDIPTNWTLMLGSSPQWANVAAALIVLPGSLIMSRYNGPIFSGKAFAGQDFTIMGDPAQTSNAGFIQTTPTEYPGWSQGIRDLRRVSICYTGSHGIRLQGGLEMVDVDSLVITGCRGYCMWIHRTPSTAGSQYFTGTVAGTVLTLTSGLVGTFALGVGINVNGGGYAVVNSLASGTLGANGSTYNLSAAPGNYTGTIYFGINGPMEYFQIRNSSFTYGLLGNLYLQGLAKNVLLEDLILNDPKQFSRQINAGTIVGASLTYATIPYPVILAPFDSRDILPSTSCAGIHCRRLVAENAQGIVQWGSSNGTFFTDCKQEDGYLVPYSNAWAYFHAWFSNQFLGLITRHNFSPAGTKFYLEYAASANSLRIDIQERWDPYATNVLVGNSGLADSVFVPKVDWDWMTATIGDGAGNPYAASVDLAAAFPTVAGAPGYAVAGVSALFLVSANFQTDGNTNHGAYLVAVYKHPTAGSNTFIGNSLAFGSTTGFAVAPAVSTAGVLTFSLSQYFRARVQRIDHAALNPLSFT